MAHLVYNNAKKLIIDGGLDWDAAGQTFRILLAAPGYVPNAATHLFVSSVTNELAGASYARKDVVGRSVTVDNAGARADCKADNVIWTGLSAGVAAWAVLYKLVTDDSDSLLIAAFDVPDTTSNGTDFAIRWDAQAANGTVFRVT